MHQLAVAESLRCGGPKVSVFTQAHLRRWERVSGRGSEGSFWVEEVVLEVGQAQDRVGLVMADGAET